MTWRAPLSLIVSRFCARSDPHEGIATLWADLFGVEIDMVGFILCECIIIGTQQKGSLPSLITILFGAKKKIASLPTLHFWHFADWLIFGLGGQDLEPVLGSDLAVKVEREMDVDRGTLGWGRFLLLSETLHMRLGRAPRWADLWRTKSQSRIVTWSPGFTFHLRSCSGKRSSTCFPTSFWLKSILEGNTWYPLQQMREMISYLLTFNPF